MNNTTPLSMDSSSFAVGIVGWFASFMATHGFILAIIISIGIVVDVAITCDCRYVQKDVLDHRHPLVLSQAWNGSSDKSKCLESRF